MGSRRTNLKNLTQLLTLPGNGVFTVQTAKDKKENLLQNYYQTKSPLKAKLKWEKNLQALTEELPIILGIPSDNGGGIQRGANWGPLAIREEILPHRKEYQDLGDVRVIPHLLEDRYLNEETIKNCRKALYGKNNKLPVSPLSIADLALRDIYRKYPKAKILGLGGDHSTSFPLVKNWIESRSNKKKSALIHFDAHTDLLDRRLGIDICFGTWAYHILKDLHSPDHLVQLGIRSSGKTKIFWKSKLGVDQYWAKDIKKLGIEKTFKKISLKLKKLGIEEIYISFDIDALDFQFASATGTPEPHGLNPVEATALIHLFSQEFNITGADLMEVAPFVSQPGSSEIERISSLKVAGDMAKSLLEVLKK
jgi:agmatinase